MIYCPTLSLDDNETKKFKDYLRKRATKFVKKIIDDNVFSNEIKLIARTYIKNKIGLKPSTIVEIIRI